MKNLLTFVLLLASAFAYSNKSSIKILIDPGHGGKDPGHIPLSDSLDLKEEKHLALDISMKVGGYLEHNLQNVEVQYTRTDDSYPTLDDRVDMANNGSVDYMLSIHINGSPNVAAYGTETHIHDYKAKDSHKWAKLIESQFKSRAGRKSRGVKTIKDIGHSIQILKYTRMPTVLVECGFITHSNEGLYLNSVNGQEIIASAIFRATREFLKTKHPAIEFELPEVPAEGEEQGDQIAQTNPTETASEQAGLNTTNQLTSEYFSVQIMASVDEVATDIPEFQKLSIPVERKVIESGSIFKYKYYVGRFANKKEAKMLQKEVREQGFPDAFLVFFD